MEFQYAESSVIIPFRDLPSGSLFLLPKDDGFLVCFAAEILNEDDRPTKISVVVGTIGTDQTGAIPTYVDRGAHRASYVVKLDGAKISPSSEGSPKWPTPAVEAVAGSLIVDRESVAWLKLWGEGGVLFVSTATGEATYQVPHPVVMFDRWSISIPEGEGRRIVAAKPACSLENL